jgi:hypothetical protein
MRPSLSIEMFLISSHVSAEMFQRQISLPLSRIFLDLSSQDSKPTSFFNTSLGRGFLLLIVRWDFLLLYPDRNFEETKKCSSSVSSLGLDQQSQRLTAANPESSSLLVQASEARDLLF